LVVGAVDAVEAVVAEVRLVALVVVLHLEALGRGDDAKGLLLEGL
jgi:hypothetical protein